MLVMLALLYTFAEVAGAPAAQHGKGTCPNCHGNAQGCTWTLADSRCPLVSLAVANAAIITATVAGTLSLHQSIKPRFLQVFAHASLDSTMFYMRRPQPGTVSIFEAHTTSRDILQAIANKQCTIELAIMRVADLFGDLDPADEANKPLIAKLERTLKIIHAAK